MKSELTYTEAFARLEQLVEELEDGNIQVDSLTEKVTLANELILICENRLRNTSAGISAAAGGIDISID